MIRTLLAGLLSAALFAPQSASAGPDKPAGFPERPLTVVVPYGTGGGSDTMGRIWAKAMSKIVGVEIRVINQPGAGGFAALPDYVARPADGYSILQHVNFVVEGEVLGRTDIKILEKLEPICTANKAYSQLYIRTDDDRFSDWKSFVEYAKANPGKVKVGNVNTELAQVKLLADAIGIEVEQINFSKPAERYASAIGRHVDVLYEQPGDVKSFLAAKQMKPILTLVKGKAPAEFPDVPILSDIGQENLATIFLARMFLVHKDAPKERKRYLEAACQKAYNSTAFQEHLKQKNLNPATSHLNAKDTLALLREQKDAFKRFHGK